MDEADQARDIEDHKIEADPVPQITLEDRDPLMRMTKQLLIDAFEQGNVQTMPALCGNTKDSPAWAGIVSNLLRRLSPILSMITYKEATRHQSTALLHHGSSKSQSLNPP